MNKLNQQYKYRLTGDEVTHHRTNNRKNKLPLIDRLILLFGALFIFYFLTVVIK